MSAWVQTAPFRGSTWGTRAPTAKNLVATAMAMRPLSFSWKMIDQVIGPSLLGARHSVAHLLHQHHMSATEWRARSNESASSPPRRVALHAARVRGGLAPGILAAGRRQPAFRPVVVHLDLMAAPTQFLDRFRRDAAF